MVNNLDGKPPTTPLRARQCLAPAIVLCALLVTGCATGNHRAGLRHDRASGPQNQQAACSMNEEGLRLLEEGDIEDAEERFRKALDHDLYYAPAHNNLGLTLLDQDEYYEAALEFDFARRLMPRAIEPRNNLGILYEELGRLGRACGEYEAALNLNPDSLITMRHLARAYVKANKKDEKLTTLLEKILLIPDGDAWDLWARGQLIRVGRSEPDSASNLD